jgi:dynein heavy chain
VKSPSADLTWQKGAKRQMANLDRFIDEELMTFDDNDMPESTLVLVEPYLKKPSFDPDTMEKKTGNSACGSLCKWVRGVVRYGIVIIGCTLNQLKTLPALMHDWFTFTSQVIKSFVIAQTDI